MAAVLFTDLVASTELLARLGEAAFDGLRRAHFASLREAIARSGGAEGEDDRRWPPRDIRLRGGRCRLCRGDAAGR